MRQWVFWLAVLASSACSSKPQTPAVLEPVHWAAQLQAPHGMRAGSRFAVLLHASIDNGWHLYALPDKDAFPLFTEVALAKNPSADLLRVEEEKPHHSIDPESHVATGWFAQSTTFTLHLAALVNEPCDLKVLVRYQACNQRMCLPAKQVTVPVLPPARP